MGEVYLAEDTKLDRKVALKNLPADVASNRDRMDRFVREANATAALNHPNIAHIYEIVESDGTHSSRWSKEFDAFRHAAERAVALNPMDESTVEYMGHLLVFAGDWEPGCALAEKARHLNPHHAAWYWALPFLDAYRKAVT